MPHSWVYEAFQKAFSNVIRKIEEFMAAVFLDSLCMSQSDSSPSPMGADHI